MHRTQVYLEDGHYEMLRARARREGKSLAAVIREILDAHFQARPDASGVDPFSDVIGVGSGDGTAVAERYEEYLYGDGS